MRPKGIFLAVAAVGIIAFAMAIASAPGPSLAEGFGTHLISTADWTTCAVISDGGVQCWGQNEDGQLGDGTTTDRSTPVDVCATGATAPCSASDDTVLTGVVGVAAGYEHTCAVTSAGTAKCWGDNDFGQLGAGTLTDSTTPVDVCATGATPPCTPGNNNILTGVAAISASMGLPFGYHTCAVMQSNGGVKCWGDNSYSQLGDGTGTLRKTPVDVCATGATAPCGGNILTGVAEIGVTAVWSCARTTAGGVKCWGNNALGQLGDGTLTQRNTPVDVCATGATPPCTPGNSNILTGVAAAQAGGYSSVGHTCALMASNGGVKCWGDQNGFGILGTGERYTNHKTPADVCATGATAPCTPGNSNILTDVADLAIGGTTNCVVMDDGGAKCWGFDGYGTGALGDGRPLPGPISGHTTTPTDVCGSDATPPCTPANDNLLSGGLAGDTGLWHTCVRTSGGLQCWGYGAQGQLGDGLSAHSSTPVDTLLDSDRDGCIDQRELQTGVGSQTSGGLRDPESFWDFFDTPDANNVRDGVVDIDDINRIVARFGSVGDPNVNPFSPPPPAPAYHPAFDRSPPAIGDDPWDARQADGIINIGDIGLAVAQNGHSCA